MDYVETFKNLRSNNKYGRKSPHKAVMMLAVIHLFEENLLTDNEIYYDETLKSMFLKVWNRVFPDESLFHSEAYLPYWYLQSDSFWHIVPLRGKEDVLSLMRDTTIKPSEAKLTESVKCAELDEDLYFLMTLPSGRSSLKRVLLETYTNLSEKQIDSLAESADNFVDYSASALSEYEKMLSKDKNDNDEETTFNVDFDSELVRQFNNLNEDVQLVLNIQYYTFLKSHRSERVMFKELFPSVYALLDKIVKHSLNKNDIAQSSVFTIDNFLSDLKIALMSEDGSMELIDKIQVVIDILRDNISNTDTQETIVETKDVESPKNDIEEVAYDDEGDASTADFVIENKSNSCNLKNGRGELLFSSSGQLIRLNDVLYRVVCSASIVSMNIIQEDSRGLYALGRRILSAHHYSPLLEILDGHNYLKQFKAVKYDSDCDEYYIQVDDRWYGSSGYYADLNDDSLENKKPSAQKFEPVSDDTEIEHVFLDSKGDVLYTVTSTPDYNPEKDVKTEDRKGKTWTPEEEERISFYYNKGIDFASIAERVGRTEVAIKARLAKLGLIEYTYEKDEDETSHDNDSNKLDKGEFAIENTLVRCSIFDKYGNRVFSSRGKLKFINGNLYRLNLKEDRFTLKSMLFENGIWVKGKSKIVAYPQTKMYKLLDEALDYCEAVEDLEDSSSFKNCRIKVDGEWFSSDGNPVTSLADKDDKKEPERTKVEPDDISSKFSVAIGDKLKVFPSQLVGKVVKLRIDKMGHGKIVVQSDDGATEEIYDTKYLYQKLPEKKNDSSKTKTVKRERIKKESIKEIIPDVDQRSIANASLGDWIQWKPTEEVGKVIAFRDDDGVRKMLVRKKNGYEIEVPDNPCDYDIMLNKQKVATYEAAIPKNTASSQNEVNTNSIKSSNHGTAKVGDWIKTNFYNDKCQVVRIDSKGTVFEKLVVEFKDGHQDWIMNKPEIYTIVD